jgi:transcriptional regulator with XRE-family HTH domain
MSSGQPREISRSAFWKEAGLLLRLLRERQGWGYPELAERAGVTPDLVVAYELARERYPEVEACMRLSAALGVTLAAFLREAERRSGVSLTAGVRPPTHAGPPLAAQQEVGRASEQDALRDFIRKADPDKPGEE